MKRHLLVTLLLACLLFAAQAQVSPMAGIATYQLLDNTGKPVAGALYFYQAGTSTQQATFTDNTGATQNPNPFAVGAGGRATVWMTTSAFYKIVGCLSALDGASCAPANVLFSVDNVPGGATSSGGGGSAPFISNSANPATSGILRLASGDSIGWRNAANSGNLFLHKDSSDLLTWDGGSLKLPEVGTPGALVGFDILYADNSAHRFKMLINGTGPYQIVAASNDINAFDAVVQLHFGASALPLGAAPATTQYLQWNGSNIVGNNPESTMSSGGQINGIGPVCTAAGTGCQIYFLTSAHTLVRVVANEGVGPITCATKPSYGVIDLTSSTTLGSVTPTATGVFDSGALSVPMTAGHQFGIGVTVIGNGCGTNGTASITAVFN